MIFDPYTPRTVGLCLRHFGFYTTHPKLFFQSFVLCCSLYYFKEMQCFVKAKIFRSYESKPLFPVYKKNVLRIDQILYFLCFYFLNHMFLSRAQQIWVGLLLIVLNN
jgi:hypothetical protein